MSRFTKASCIFMPFPHNFMAWIPTKMLGLLLHQLEFASFSLLAMKSSFHLKRCAVHERFEYYSDYSDVFSSLPNKTFGIKWKCVVSWYLKLSEDAMDISGLLFYNRFCNIQCQGTWKPR